MGEQGDKLTCLACGAEGIGIGFAHKCDPFAARRERARILALIDARLMELEPNDADVDSQIHGRTMELRHMRRLIAGH